MQSIAILGAGYVGTTMAACLSQKGFNVTLSDIDSRRIGSITSGKSLIFEEGLSRLIEEATSSGRLLATLDRRMAVSKSDMIFITVGTPSRRDGSIDLRFVKAASREVGEALRNEARGRLVIVRSTITPGTTNNLVRRTIERFSGFCAGQDFQLCFQPEFLREGSSIQDFQHPDRIIIGQHSEAAGKMLEGFWRSYFREPPPILRMSLEAAEMVKYASNAFLATKISFINEIANICQRLRGVDVVDVAKGVGLDLRIGSLFLQAGLGYGGSCFPKDLLALMRLSKAAGYTPKILNATRTVNEQQPLQAIKLVRRALGGLRGKKVALLGLAFKPGTDDMREAPSIKIVNALKQQGAKVIAYDPVAVENAKLVIPWKIKYASNVQECLKGADCCIVVTEWDEFRSLKPEDFLASMRQAVLIDGRRIYDPDEFLRKMKYYGIGVTG